MSPKLLHPSGVHPAESSDLWICCALLLLLWHSWLGNGEIIHWDSPDHMSSLKAESFLWWKMRKTRIFMGVCGIYLRQVILCWVGGDYKTRTGNWSIGAETISFFLPFKQRNWNSKNFSWHTTIKNTDSEFKILYSK